MFVKNEALVNKTVVLTRDMKVLGGTFLVGTELRCIGQSRRGYNFEDAEENKLLETGLDENFYKVKE